MTDDRGQDPWTLWEAQMAALFPTRVHELPGYWQGPDPPTGAWGPDVTGLRPSLATVGTEEVAPADVLQEQLGFSGF